MHCILALAWAVEEARKDGVKGAEPGWLSGWFLEWNFLVGARVKGTHSQGRRRKAADFFQVVSDPREQRP